MPDARLAGVEHAPTYRRKTRGERSMQLSMYSRARMAMTGGSLAARRDYYYAVCMYVEDAPV